MQADLRKEESIVKVLQAVQGSIKQSGGVDILVNNAACFNFESVDNLSEAGDNFTFSDAPDTVYSSTLLSRPLAGPADNLIHASFL